MITGDVPMCASPEQALEGIRLLMLVNDVSLRNLIPEELAKGASASSEQARHRLLARGPSRPTNWARPGKAAVCTLDLHSFWNERQVGRCNASPEMTFPLTSAS